MKKERILVLAITQSLIALSTGMLGPVYAIYFERIVGNISLVALIIGIYWIIVGVFELLLSHLIDKFGKSKMFVMGGIISSFAILLYPMVKDLVSLVFVEVINAIGYSFQVPAFFSLLAEVTSRKKRGKEIGFIDSFWNIGYGISAIFSSILISIFGLSFIFFVASFFNGISSFLVRKKIDI
ncbi:MAG: MFS transporter [Candidatus Aenigmatarchaeota archaeon]